MADTPVSEEEYAYETLRRFYDYTDVVDGVKGLKNKMFENLGVGDNFCISLMQMNKKTKYMDYFCQILEEENIPYKILGIFKNHLPISKVKSAPIYNGNETL